MKNLLFVSISFPPKNDPECLQTARYFYYLQKSGEFSTTVVTSKSPTLYMPRDESLERYLKGIHQFIEIPLLENKILNYGLRKIGLGKLMFPDSKMTFYWQWKSVTRQTKIKPDIIYSRSNPVSSAFMAMKLKAYFKCPWVMHLSDPWAISPLNEIPDDQNRYLEFEARLLRQADAVTFTTEQTLTLYKTRYPWAADKLKVLPNVYDPMDAVENEPPQVQKLRIVYTGGLGARRSVFFLEQVFELLKRELPEYEKEVEFIFAGDIDRANNFFFKKDLPAVKHIGLLSYAKAKELCLTAHLLLIVDNPTSSGDAIFFPSKLLDYFLTRRKIWAVTPANSTTRKVLQGYKHEAFEHQDVRAMADFLLGSILELKGAGTDSFVSDRIPAQYSAAHNAKALGQLLLSLK